MGLKKGDSNMKLNINKGRIESSTEELGYIPSNIDQIDKHLIQLIEDKKLIGAGYILAKDDKVFAHRSMGSLRYDSDDINSFKPDAIRKISSLTKIYTAISIMQLVERGKIHLKQQVKFIIKEFDKKMYKDITIFHLLTHTGGISPTPGGLNEPYPLDYNIFKREEWIKEGLRGYPYATPGEKWAYSPFSFMLLAEIVKRVSGFHFEEYVKKNIFEPLELENTFFNVPKDCVERVCVPDKQSETLLKQNNESNLGAPKGSTGIYSTLWDMSIVGRMLINKGIYNGVRILSRKSVEKMTRNQLKNIRSFCWNDNGMEISFGLGLSIYFDETLLSPGSFGHEGSGLNGIFMDPYEKLLLIYFCPPPIRIWIPEPVVNLRNIVWSGIK